MPKRKTHEKYIKEVYNLVGDEYTILGKYINSTTKIEIRHNVCGLIYKQRAGSILTGRRCPFCFGTHKTTNKEFQEELNKLHPGEFDVIGEYVNAHTPILLKHKICNNTYDVTPHSIRKGAYCRYCSKKASKTKEEFEQQLYSLVGDEYSLVGKYINMSTKTVLKHNICGHEWNIKPTDFATVGTRCPKCYGKNNKKTHEQFINEVYELVGDEYTVLGTYVNMSTKIKMKHNKCGYEYEVRPCDFEHNMSRCPRCKSSKGEYEISKVLDSNGIKYESQKWYDGLVSDNNKHLTYDFFLPDYNLLIEYQGQQHEYAVEWFGGKEKFIRQQEFDNQKREYAKSNNIKLLEIWYYDFKNINKILTKELKLCV